MSAVDMTPTVVAMLTAHHDADWSTMWTRTYMALDDMERIGLVGCLAAWLSEMIDVACVELGADRDDYLRTIALAAAENAGRL